MDTQEQIIDIINWIFKHLIELKEKWIAYQPLYRDQNQLFMDKQDEARLYSGV